jgi:enediyne biosynthesis protein E4
VRDFFGNGSTEQVITFYKHGESYPFAGRDELTRSIPQLRGKYPSYASFGASRIEDIFPAAELRQAEVLEAREFASSIAINKGGSGFSLLAMPTPAQFAPVYATIATDVDGDGVGDLVIAGNLYGAQPALGRYDASEGLVLRGTRGSDGTVEAEGFSRTGLRIEGEVRRMKLLRLAGGGRAIAVARNNERLQVLRLLR